MRWTATVGIGILVSSIGIASADDDAPPTENQSDPGVYVLVGTLALNTTFTVIDIATIGESKPKIYGFAETMLTVPQALLFTGLTPLFEEDRWIPASLALWTGALAAHGIYTLATREPAERSPRTVMFSVGSQF